ncbi:penicillin-insensitive murein endopeptidase [Massilia oculi]|uniref:Penicillin-insensitive murein endopeptidase n=1 Tax=Massilia hydrophila TaxID=3044279 RepID=A0ABS7Y8E7_9BURK|nr:penicillin-insensitive murein endopeptidase [Massilia oculi]MCA1855598.1 penicillin-insensitive murein endopeptidase [Massilia oculi]
MLPALLIPLAAAALMALPAPAAAADATTSTCYGNPAHGRIEGAVALPAQGNNFEPYAQRGVELGRTWVHASVRDIVLDAYRALETGQPDITFVYGETGLQTGGPMPPHRTHQAGVSVDFMVPVRGADGRPATLPRSAAQRFGYGLEFDSSGRWQGYRIDFAALADHLRLLDHYARARGARIGRVILDPPFVRKLHGTPAWPWIAALPFMKARPWIRHDEHYHVDFVLPCAPLR